MFDIRDLSPNRKAQLRSQLDEDMGSPLHNSSSSRTRQTHTNRKRNLNDTSLTASPASPPQPGTARRVAKKSKKAGSAPPSFRIVSPAPVAAKTVSNLIGVQSNSDSDSSATVSQGKQTVVPSVSGSQPSAVRIESQAAVGTTPYTRMAPTEFMKNKLQWHSLLLELAKHSKETLGPIKDITDSDQFSALVSFLAPPRVVVARDDSEEMVRGIQRLAANGNDEKGGVRAVSALIHQTGMTLSQRGQDLLPETLKAEYTNRVPRPPPATTAILPAIAYFLRVNDSSIGLTVTQKLVTTGYCAVVTPGGGTCGAAGLLIGLIGHTSEPLELAIREVGHKAIIKTLNTRMEEVEESQRGEHRLRILRQDYGLSQKATEEEWSANIRKRDVSLEVSKLSAITAALGVKLKLFINSPNGLPEPQLLGDLASDITVQLVHRGMGPLGGHYAAVVKQGLSEAPFSEEGLKELILKVDVGIAVPEKVRGDKANINSDTLGNYAPHGQAISTVYPYINYIREYYNTTSREKLTGAGPPLKSSPLQGAWNKGAPAIHPGGDHPADVQCCINYTLGRCKENSGCRFLHRQVKCRFEQHYGKCDRDSCSFGHTEGAKRKVCRYFQTNTCNREFCRFEHKVLDRNICWAAYEQHCKHGTHCRYRHLDTGAIP